MKSLKASFSEKNKYLNKILSNGHFRILMIAALGGGWNFIYALYHLVLAIIFHSYWFLTMGIYYMAICGMRASALCLSKKANQIAKQKALRKNAFLTFLSAFIFSGVVCLTIIEKRNTVYNRVVAISMAAYTFYCATAAILNLIHLKKNRTIQRIMLRNCSMVCAIGSLFGLERMMLGTFGGRTAYFTLVMEAASGAGFFVVLILLGVNLLILASKNERTYIC